MRSGVRKKLDDFYSWVENTYRAKARIRQVKKTLKSLDGGNKKNDDKFEEYRQYWEKYGKKPSKIWLRLYAKDGEDFDPRYIPDDYWFGEILPYFCNMNFRRPYEDKNFHDKMFPYFNRPETIVKCMAGINYDSEGKEISRDELLDIILTQDEAIMKPSIDSGMGRLIQFYDKKTDDKISLDNKLKELGDNFIVQKILKQHEKMNSLNPNSLNTIRVISLLFKGEAHILSIIARMGSGDAKIDNVSAGGLQITVNEDGTFTKYASDKSRHKHEKHPDTGIVFEGFEIPAFDKIIECVKKGQLNQPHFKIIGWDFAVGEDSEPVFIEYNVMPGANQMTGGPTFGDLTEEVLQEVYIDKTFEHAHN